LRFFFVAGFSGVRFDLGHPAGAPPSIPSPRFPRLPRSASLRLCRRVIPLRGLGIDCSPPAGIPPPSGCWRNPPFKAEKEVRASARGWPRLLLLRAAPER
jgi:hypothetical protein